MTQITKFISFVLLVGLISSSVYPATSALSEPPPQALPMSLSFYILKMTGDEYVMIKNNSSNDITDLSAYSLKAFNNFNPLASGVSITVQPLPAFSLAQGSSMLLSSTVRLTCGADIAGKLSISLLDGGGRLDILKNQNSTTLGSTEIIDSVSWSSTTSGQIKSVPSNSKAPHTVYYRTESAGDYSWQIAEAEPTKPCQLKVPVSGTTVKSQVIISADENTSPQLIDIDTVAPEIPETEIDVNAGLLPVQITELLPNPLGPGTDLTDEFIELYNPNTVDYDLSGLKLQTGVTRLYNYTFEPGIILPAKTYKAYYASETGLSLSNTSGQARLLAPNGEQLSTTDVYKAAKDGQSWSLVGTVWGWSEAKTPNSLNVGSVPKNLDKKLPPPSNSLAKKAVRGPAVKKPKLVKPPKSAKSAKPVKPKKIKVEKSTKYSTGPTQETMLARPVQTKLVATVGSVALLYGAYEYRTSLANGFYKLRRKLGIGG